MMRGLKQNTGTDGAYMSGQCGKIKDDDMCNVNNMCHWEYDTNKCCSDSPPTNTKQYGASCECNNQCQGKKGICVIYSCFPASATLRVQGQDTPVRIPDLKPGMNVSCVTANTASKKFGQPRGSGWCEFKSHRLMNTTKDLAHYKITIGVEKLLKTVGGDTGNGGAAAAALPRARSNYKRTVTMTMSVSHLGYVLDHAALSSATKANAALKGSKVFKSMNVFSGLGRLIPAAWIEPGMYMMVNDAPGKPMQLGEVIENELVTSDGYYQINIDSPWPLVDDVMVHTHISSSSNMKSFKALWTIKFGGKVMRMDQLTPAESDRLYVTYRHVTDADAWGNSLEELNAMGLHTMDGVNALYKAKRANKNPATEDKMILPGRHMDLDAAVAWVNKRVAAKKADPTLPPITYEEITTKIPEFTSDEV